MQNTHLQSSATALHSTRLPPQVPVVLPIPQQAHAIVYHRHPFIKPNDDMLTNIQATFIVRPNVQNDIYELFVSRNKTTIFHNFAHIPNYKTSVMMNKLFRKIKENERLDTMEESDDEEEFENVELDKFVSMKNEYRMVCRLNKKFCKWVPIQISVSSDIISELQVTQHEFRYLPKKYTSRNYAHH
jgi:hypothetical protein